MIGIYLGTYKSPTHHHRLAGYECSCNPFWLPCKTLSGWPPVESPTWGTSSSHTISGGCAPVYISRQPMVGWCNSIGSPFSFVYSPALPPQAMISLFLGFQLEEQEQLFFFLAASPRGHYYRRFFRSSDIARVSSSPRKVLPFQLARRLCGDFMVESFLCTVSGRTLSARRRSDATRGT